VVWFHAIAESRHELQNPTSAEKIRLVGAAAALGPEYGRDLLGWAMLVGWKPPQPATGSP